MIVASSLMHAVFAVAVYLQIVPDYLKLPFREARKNCFDRTPFQWNDLMAIDTYGVMLIVKTVQLINRCFTAHDGKLCYDPFFSQKGLGSGKR